MWESKIGGGWSSRCSMAEMSLDVHMKRKNNSLVMVHIDQELC